MQQMYSKSFRCYKAWLKYIRTPSNFAVSLLFCVVGGLQPLRPMSMVSNHLS